MLAFAVPKVTEVEIVVGPSPDVRHFREGREARWLRWRENRWHRVDIDKVLRSLNQGDLLALCRLHGPLVTPYTPAWARKLLEEGWLYVPLEAAENAFGLLRVLAGSRKIHPDGMGETLQIAGFLQELYDQLSDRYRQRSEPLREILIVAEDGKLKAALSSQVRPWNRDYALRIPVKGQDLRPEGRKGWRFNGRVAVVPGKEVALCLPCLFPALLHRILEGSAFQVPVLCACGCGELARPGCKYSDPSHRKRVWWRLNRGKDVAKKTSDQREEGGGHA